jgi:hypothetical protein
MAPSEFYRLLYSELALILEGRRERLLRESRRMREESAWLGSIILAPHTPKDGSMITPDQLLGRKPRSKPAPKFATPGEAAQAFFSARNAKLKKDGDAHGQ